MPKLSKILRVKVPPAVILISGLAIVGLLTALGGILHYDNEISNNSEISIENTFKEQEAELAEKTTAASKKTSGSNNYSNESSNGSYEDSAGSPQLQAATSSSTASRAGSSNSGSGRNVSYVKVFLSVNGSPKGSVTLKSTANQCDVLRQAYSNELISSLTMKYNSQYKTYGVYVIDGIGDPNSVWWVYTVNNRSQLGCSYVKVNGGDVVNWQYIKN